MAVVLINPFEVPASAGESFVTGWRSAADYMARQPGFLGTRLHRALSADARFGFVNLADWESPQAFMQAVANPEFGGLASGSPPNYPSLYEVVVTKGGDRR